jgi:hypothetical protein
MYRSQLLAKLLIVSICLVVPLTGCLTSTRYIASPTTPPQDSGLAALSGNIEAKLHYVITPDGPGSWVQGAKWNEWVVSIRNVGQSDVMIQKIGLIDHRGVHVGPEYASVHQLESESDKWARFYKDNYVGGAISSAIMAPAASAVMAAGSAAAAIPFIYLAQFAGSANPYLEAKDRESIQAEFAKRTLPAGLQLSGGGSLRGSVFFPLLPQPQALVMTYVRPGEWKETQIKIPLDKMSTTQTAQQP